MHEVRMDEDHGRSHPLADEAAGKTTTTTPSPAAQAFDFPAIAKNIVGHETVETVDARALHVALWSRKDFSSWIKKRIADAQLEEGMDFLLLTHLGEQSGRGGHNAIDYALTLDAAKEVAMLEKNARGKAVRQYFIAAEKALKQAQKALLEAERAKLAAQAPKVEAYTDFMDSDGTFSRDQAAKIIGVFPPQMFNAYLREALKWTFTSKDDSGERVRQRAIKAGYMEEKVYFPDRGLPRTTPTMLPKGLEKARAAILKHVESCGNEACPCKGKTVMREPSASQEANRRQRREAK